jgi:fructosamine-3-kinase
VETAERMAGGQIDDVWEVTLGDRRRVVVKRTRAPATFEAEGLGVLSAAGAPVPEVLSHRDHVLVMTHVSGAPDWAGLGRSLATVHRSTGEAFGWHRDNVLGPLPQRNTPSPDWPTFYAERRIVPYLGIDDLPDEAARRLERACHGPMLRLLDHDPVPSLVHGDLWAGNVVDGRWLIDPAVHHADREVELAYMDLFGRLPRPMWDAYLDAWPLAEGWEQRRPALQLYNLLVHVAIFGRRYVEPIVSRLDDLGW